MPTTEEKMAFAGRLKKALKRSPKRVTTPTELALNFNLRHPNETVTPQAAQKWLAGQSMPTVDKIKTLAEWLNVSVNWLRFGVAEERGIKTKARQGLHVRALPSDQELALLDSLRKMPEHRRQLVLELVEQLVLDQSVWRDV